MPTVPTSTTAVLALRAPIGDLAADDFEIAQVPLPQPQPGQVMFRGIYLAIDPSARRRLPVPSGTTPPNGATTAIGEPVLAGVVPASCGLDGALVGVVLDSRHPDFAPGDLVRGGNSWQEHHVVDGALLDRVERHAGVPLTAELGVLGRAGFVGAVGMETFGSPLPGETVVVSAVGGGVGMVAAQWAKAAGANVIGIASGDKAQWAVDNLGIDGCIDRSTEAVAAGLARLCPDGIDIYFDNVGGATGSAAFDRLRDFGRMVVCGMASEYSGEESLAGPPLRPILRKRLRIQGFVIYDHYHQYADYRRRALRLMAQQRLNYRIDLAHGLASAPQSLQRVLTGQTSGRVLIQLGPES